MKGGDLMSKLKLTDLLKIPPKEKEVMIRETLKIKLKEPLNGKEFLRVYEEPAPSLAEEIGSEIAKLCASLNVFVDDPKLSEEEWKEVFLSNAPVFYEIVKEVMEFAGEVYSSLSPKSGEE